MPTTPGRRRLPSTRPPGLRHGLLRLSDGLIAFGVVGIVVALLGLVALAWASGRVSAVADSVDIEVKQMTLTLDRTADTLHDAGSLAGSFAVTLERTPPTVRQAALTIRNLRPNLEEIGSQLASINILGSAPLAGPARLFDEMALGLQDLDTQLELVASDLETDRDALLANARSLTEAGDQAAVLADRVRAGFIQDGLDDLRTVLWITIVVLVGWAAVPAIGALVLGLWLRRTLATTSTTPIGGGQP
jgi:hypothetical protein